MPAAQDELAETAGPSNALASLRSGRDDNIDSTNFQDRTLVRRSVRERRYVEITGRAAGCDASERAGIRAPQID